MPRRSGHGGYLQPRVFHYNAPPLGEQAVMAVLAYRDDQAVAGALYFRSKDTLYGRYWAVEQEYDCLHFEACYYRGIEYCIAMGLKIRSGGPRRAQDPAGVQTRAHLVKSLDSRPAPVRGSGRLRPQ